MAAAKRKKDLVKFQLLGAVNYIFIKQRVKSSCVMFQKQFLHRDVLNQITNPLSYSLLLRKTRKQTLPEQCDQSHVRRNMAGAEIVHRHLTQLRLGAGGRRMWPSQQRRTRRRSQALTPAKGQPVWDAWRSAACPEMSPCASIATFANGARK